MNRDSLILQDAAPDLDEGQVFAHYVDEAFEGFFHAMLGRRFAEMVAAAYVQPGHDFSWQNTVFAKYDKTIVGMVCGYTAGQHRLCSLQPLKLAAGPGTMQKIGAALICARLRLLGAHADGDFYIQAAAVDSAFRGRGIGSALLDAIEDRARAGGSGRLVLDVWVRNKGARRLYERRGLTVESCRRKLLRLPRFILRMTKPL